MAKSLTSPKGAYRLAEENQDGDPEVGSMARSSASAAAVEASQQPTPWVSRHKLPLASGLLAVVTTISASLYVAKPWASIAPPPQVTLTEGTSSLRFLGIGDWGREASYDQKVTAEVLGAAASVTNASFVISVGDNFYDYGVKDESDALFDRSFRHVYTHPAQTQLPWYTIAGNHDYRGNLTAQMVYRGDPRWNFPSLNYTRTWRLPNASADDVTACLRAVFIDSTPLLAYYRQGMEDKGRLMANLNATSPPGQQYAWINGQLARAEKECRAVIVVSHHPIFTAGEHGDSLELKRFLLPMLVKYKVDALLSGHDHLMNHLVANGTDFVITGAGSRVRTSNVATPETAFLLGRGGFTVHSVNGTHISHSYVQSDASKTVFEVVRPLKPKGAAAGARRALADAEEGV